MNSKYVRLRWVRRSAGLFVATLVFLAAATFIALAEMQVADDKPLGCESVSGPPPTNFSQPPNLEFIKRELLYYRCTKYDDDIAAVLAEARKFIEKRAPQVENPAIVLDIDETSLSNWTRIKMNDFGYIPLGRCDVTKAKDILREACGDEGWKKSGKAPAIKATLELFNFAKCRSASSPANCKPIAVFFVTGRYNDPGAQEMTETNLTNALYKDWDGIYMRGRETEGQPVSRPKTAARQEISKKYTIIANIGDQDIDLVGGYAERTFKLPNPFYSNP
jgi:hypothetical protein